MRDAIGTLPYGLTLHNFNNLNPENITPSEREKVQKWDKPGRTVMAGGNYQIHPDMERNLTLREIACIQTFPLDFQFSGKKKKQERQIGNAVPPRMSEALLRQVRKALVESDIRLRADEAPGWAASSQTICLDGEDDVAEYFG